MRVGSVRQEALIGGIDQVVSSLTNFVGVVVAARSLGVEQFGAFSAAYAVFVITVSAQRAVVGQEVVLQVGAAESVKARARESVAFSLALGLGSCAVVLAAIPLVSSQLDSPILVLALVLPLLYVQDAVRFSLSALGEMRYALAADLFWLFGAAFALVVVDRLGKSDPAWYFAAWSVPGCISGAVFGAKFVPGGRISLGRFSNRSFLGYRFFVEFLVSHALSQALMLLIGALAGVAIIGAIRGATAVFGPISVVTAAAASFGAPIIRRLEPTSRERLLFAGGTFLVGVTCLVSLVLWTLPESLGQQLLGTSWIAAREMIPPIAVQTIFLTIATTVILAIRMVEPAETLRLRLASALPIVPLFLVGYFSAGAVGAVWGLNAYSACLSMGGSYVYLCLRSGGKGLAAMKIEDGSNENIACR